MPFSSRIRELASRPPSTSSPRILFAALVLVACTSPPASLRADVEAYLFRLNDWAAVEAETSRAVDRIFATQFVDDAEVRRQIAADAPRARRHAERLRAFRPRTPALQGLHRDYVEAWEGLVTGYDMIDRALANGDHQELAAGRRALEEWRSAIVATAARLRRLVDESGARPPSTSAVPPTM